MATNDEISAGLNDATDLNIRPAQMVALLNRTIAAGPATNGSYTVQVNSRGTAITYATLADLLLALKHYEGKVISDAGGVFGAPGEFVSG